LSISYQALVNIDLAIRLEVKIQKQYNFQMEADSKASVAPNRLKLQHKTGKAGG
jgi:hypothetical protein